MNPHEFKRRFPRASKSVVKLNTDNVDDTASTKKPELLDKKQVSTHGRKEKMEKTHSLIFCEIEYFCAHGQKLDPSDNAIYGAVKPIADALVTLGFAGNDKDFETKARQRMDENNSNI